MSSDIKLQIVKLLTEFATEKVIVKGIEQEKIDYNKIIECFKANGCDDPPIPATIRKWFNKKANPEGKNLKNVCKILTVIYFPNDYKAIIDNGKSTIEFDWKNFLEKLIDKNPDLLNVKIEVKKETEVSVLEEITALLGKDDFSSDKSLIEKEILPFFKRYDFKVKEYQADHLYQILKTLTWYVENHSPQFYLHMGVFSTKKITLFDLFRCLRQLVELSDIRLIFKSLRYILEINDKQIKVVEIADMMRLPDRIIMKPEKFKELISGSELENLVTHPDIENWDKYPSQSHFKYIAHYPPYHPTDLGKLLEVKSEIAEAAKIFATFSDVPNHCVISNFKKFNNQDVLIITSSKSDKTNLDFYRDTPIVEKAGQVYRYYGHDLTRPSAESPTHWAIHHQLASRKLAHEYLVHLHNSQVLSKAGEIDDLPNNQKLISIDYLPYGTDKSGLGIAAKMSSTCHVINVKEHGQWYVGKSIDDILELVSMVSKRYR